MEFFLDWESYKAGFGTATGEHWLGNDNIYMLSNNYDNTYELRVDLNDGAESRFAVYRKFTITDENDNYRLSLGLYDGISNAGNFM